MLLRKTWSVDCHVISPANVGYVRGCLERGSIPHEVVYDAVFSSVDECAS